MSRVVDAQMKVDDALRAIFRKRFDIDSEGNIGNPGYQAWALQAIEVAIAMANMIIDLNNPEAGRGRRSKRDLAYALNANDFWVKNGNVLMPLIITTINAADDALNLAIDLSTYREYAGYDTLIAGARCAPLEIFSMLLYLVGGPLLMATASTPLKLDLMPYLVSR